MLSAIIISPDESFRDNARELLKGSDLIEVRAELNNFNSPLDSRGFNEIKNMESAIIIVDVTSAKEQGFQTIEKTIELYRHSYVFVAGDRTDRELILRCMRAGAKEFLSAPIESQQLFLAIEHVRMDTRIRPFGP
jgi:pilus assembly protein CpaE